MIIVSITGPRMKEAFAQVAGSTPYADIFEFRLDLIEEPSLSLLLSSTRKPIIATCRPKWEGGKFEGTERERMEVLETASMLGASYIDLELKTDKTFLKEFLNRRGESNLIISHHQFAGERIDAAKVYMRMRAHGADIFKFAYTADDVSDIRHAIEFLEMAKRDRQKAIAIAMGDYGEPTRILYKKFNGWATYAATEDGKTSAPGQIPASELKQLYRSDRISPRTKVFGVIGNPLNQSKGVYMHNPLFHRAKKDAVYCKFPVKNLRKFMKYVAPLLSGFSITIPYKQEAIKYLDRVDKTAMAIGACNTAVRRKGKLYGTNTDAPAALDAIETVARVKKKTMLIVGAGGAARAIAFEARRRGANVLIMNRDKSKAEKLANEFGLKQVERAGIRIAPYDFLVNATSVGMTPNVNESPAPKQALRNKIVFDAVFNPPMTKLLQDAQSVGAKIVEGTEMYINQAALQFELYAGVKPSKKFMRHLLDKSKSFASPTMKHVHA